MMKKEKNIEHDLKVMETVEKNLDAQKHDAVYCLIVIMCLSNIWVIIVALWDYLGRPFKPNVLTLVVEVISVVVLFMVLRNTKIKLLDFGLKVDNLKETLTRAIIISAVCVGILVLAKYILHPGERLFCWEYFDHKYLPTAIFQEFICRGGLLSILVRVNNSKNAKLVGLISSTFLFSSLHLYYGFPFMVGAAALSFFLGLVYLKDRNIVGVSIIHWFIGTAVFVLNLF